MNVPQSANTLTGPRPGCASSVNMPAHPRISQTGSKWDRALKELSKEDQEQLGLVNKSLDEPHIVLDAILEAANKRKEACVEKRWKLVINGRPVYIRDVLEKLSVWVKKLLAIGDIAIQYDPEHAALPWAAMRFIMQSSINDLEVFGHIIVSLESLASIVAQCHIIETVYLGGRKPKMPELSIQLTESVIDLYTAVLRYLADIIQHLGLSTGKRIFKSIGQSQEDFQAKYLPVKQAFENFGRLAGIAQTENLGHGLVLIEDIERQLRDKDARDEGQSKWLKAAIEQLRQPIDRIDTRLQRINDGLDRWDRVGILKAISAIQYSIHHKTAGKDRIEGTGLWFLARTEFRRWRTSSSPSVLWLHGIPGSGKTKLTSLVIEELLDHEHVAYFYCTRNPAEPERAQCDKILGSLVQQLASTGLDRPILNPVVKYYKDAIEQAGNYITDLALTTDESKGLLLELFAEYPAVAIVIDALDEVNQDSRQELLNTLSALVENSPSLVRVFISSRSNHDIKLHLKGTPNIYIEAEDNAEDISSFIEQRLTKANLLHGTLSRGLRDTIVNTLKEGANGMFRWVDLQIQSLRPLKLAEDVRSRLGTLPTTLEDSYWEILQQIKATGENALRLATFTFQWLLRAENNMPLGGFAVLASTALATELYANFTAAEVLDVCCNLIIERDGFFEFVHLSVREFFEGLHSRGIDTYLPEESHAALAQACLRYLNQALEAKDITEYDFSAVTYTRGGPGDEGRFIYAPNAWSMTTKWDIRYVYDKALPGIRAIISSDYRAGVPSRYVARRVVHHINKAGALRLRPELGNLLKAFLIQPAGPTSESSRTKWPSEEAIGFSTWAELMYSGVGRSGGPKARILESPVWLACESEWLEIVEHLYKHPYSTIDQEKRSIKDSVFVKGSNPYWAAVKEGRVGLAKCIAASTTNKSQTLLSGQDNFRRFLGEAAMSHDLEAIERLVGMHDGDYEAVSNALSEVAFLGYHETMRLVFKPSLMSSKRDEADSLAIACANGLIKEVNLLIANATTVIQGNRFLYLAVSAGHVEVVRLLLGKHIALDGLSTALTIAVSKEDNELTNLLIQHGAKKDDKALDTTLNHRKPQIALRLVRAGYKSKGTLLGETPLHLAVRLRHHGLVKALLADQAGVNVRDSKQQTPLHIAAASSESCEIIEALLGNQAEVNVLDSSEETPLHYINERSGCDHCINLLEENGADRTLGRAARWERERLAYERDYDLESFDYNGWDE
ncbi:hypothetical protein NUW58_g2655 [Xylaria curta]|uniref:Uncharacterized protein n=1 Tax=Xylaria curta TaxID=42375 RepID=A0ACC1PF32_9PEZI|nr:hypothetical protein NUW58_g2655 [Xylaria curta]